MGGSLGDLIELFPVWGGGFLRSSCFLDDLESTARVLLVVVPLFYIFVEGAEPRHILDRRDDLLKKMEDLALLSFLS